MEYQKIISLLENTPNQPSQFGIKSWIKVTDELRRTLIAKLNLKHQC